MPEPEIERVEYIPWNQIVPDPAQPREDIPPDHVERVAESIKKRGLLQYPRVRFDAALGKYVIIVGHCRWLACQKAKLDPVPCTVVSGEPSADMILLDQITENELRQGLKPIALARALAKLKSMKKWTGEQLAAETGLSSASISRSAKLLTLPEEVQSLVDAEEIDASTAYEISHLPTPEGQLKLSQKAAAGKWSREKVAETVRGEVGERKPKATDKPEGSRLNHKLDGGVSVTVSADHKLTRADMQAAIDYLRAEANKLPKPPKAPKPAAEDDATPALAQAS